jgi:hypothetical protein
VYKLDKKKEKIKGCGDSTLPRGWYDLKNNKQAKDFCRNLPIDGKPTWICRDRDSGQDYAAGTYKYDPTLEYSKFLESNYECV